MNRSPVYHIAWERHPAHEWHVLNSKCRRSWPTLLRIVRGRRWRASAGLQHAGCVRTVDKWVFGTGSVENIT